METKRIQTYELDLAAALLRAGEVVAFPTETVYGLGGHIFIEEALKRIFAVKGRPGDNPLIAHIADLDSVDRIAQNVPAVFYTLAQAFFPGPLTLIVPKRPEVSSLVSGGLDSIAIRMPSHELARELIALVGAPVVAPSANISGKPSGTRVEDVLEDFEGVISGVVVGEPSSIGIESTVVSLLEDVPILLRPGSIEKSQIEEILGFSLPVNKKVNQSAPLSPGMKYRHYAPKAKIQLFSSYEEARSKLNPNAVILARYVSSQPSVWPLSQEEFYALLRKADREGFLEIYIVCDADTRSYLGFMNRIQKAAGVLGFSDSELEP